MKYSDYMVFLKQGKILASCRPEAVVNEALLEMVYDIPMRIVPYDGRIVILR